MIEVFYDLILSIMLRYCEFQVFVPLLYMHFASLFSLELLTKFAFVSINNRFIVGTVPILNELATLMS